MHVYHYQLTMKATRIMMFARKVWYPKLEPTAADRRRREIMLAFRPSPEIQGFNLHYLAAAAQTSGQESMNEEIGHIRKRVVSEEEIEQAQQRLDNLPKSLKKDMEELWKDTSQGKSCGLWIRELIKRSSYGGSVNLPDYWGTAVRLAKKYLVEGPTNLMKIMEEGGFLDPEKEHDRAALHAYLNMRIGKRVYITFKYSNELQSHTLDGVYLLFDMESDEVIDHPNKIATGKFRIQRIASGGGSKVSTGGGFQ